MSAVAQLSSGAIPASVPMRRPPRSTPDAVGHARFDTQAPDADGYHSLRVIAELHEDIQRVRIAIGNRIDHAPIDRDLLIAATGVMNDTERRKYGLKKTGLCLVEDRVEKIMLRTYRRVVEPEIREWQKEAYGIGEHMLARLLGVIGHPVRTTVHRTVDNVDKAEVRGKVPKTIVVAVCDKERRVSDLWSYCGHGDATRQRRKGMSAEDALRLGSPRAKTLVYLMAESCLKAKARSPYGPVYDMARAKYEVDPRYAEWTDGHRHNSALRLVGKEILRDLWEAAR